MVWNVVVADDHSLIRHALSSMIEMQPDMTCMATCNDLRSVSQVLANQTVDLLVCDLRFPDGNALCSIGNWRRITSAKIVISSACSPSLFETSCIAAGADAYVHKSCDIKQLIERLREPKTAQPESSFSRAAGSPNNLGREYEMSKLHLLSQREWDVFHHIGKGLSTREIAKQLFLSCKTIESHRINIKQKLDCSSKDRLISIASQVMSS